MKIESLDRDVQQVLSTGYYRIPRFQRPYSWTDENLEEFWTDTIVESPSDYFIGAVIVFQTGKDRFDVVDGQQRLTTLTIMLSSLRNAFDRTGGTKQASGVHNFIERPNVEDEPEYILQTETSYPYFHEHIQKHGPPETSGLETGSEERTLEKAKRFFDDKLTAVVQSIASDPRIKEADRADLFRSALVKMRDQVLSLKLILVTVDNEDDAYTIFETLNSRGMNLTVADLVKNHLLRNLRKRNAKVDLARDKWDSIHDLFEASSANIDQSRFIHHQWLSGHDYVSGPKLFRQIKTDVTKQEAHSYLDELVSDSLLYRTIHEPDWETWPSGSRQIRDSLSALNIFSVDQPTPFVLAVLKALKDKRIKAALARRALRLVENYHFIFTAVTGASSSGGITKMYARHAREVSAAADADVISRSVEELGTKLKIPSEEVFVASFRQLGYSSSASKQKPLVRYILERHYAHHASGATPDFGQMTIEHLLPESGGSGAHVACIGNLILVDEPLNSLLGAKDFQSKLSILSDPGQAWIDPEVLAATSWDKATNEQRAENMARLAYAAIWT